MLKEINLTTKTKNNESEFILTDEGERIFTFYEGNNKYQTKDSCCLFKNEK